MNKKLMLAILTIFGLLLFGTILFHFLEGWNFVDSFYFTGITMTTIGYGDLHPTHDLSKILTVFFGIVTLTIFLFCLRVIISEEFLKAD